MEHTKPLVVITGITGFVGSQVCKYFLQDGSFRVRGTVRDKNNAERIAPIKNAFGSLFDELELVNADLMKADSILQAVAGCDYVVHTASPFPSANPRNEDELIKPAVEGTLAVMRAAHQHKVKRVVITSSAAAIMNQTQENQKKMYDENDWSDLAACTAYDKSKTLAEKAAWEFIHNLPENEKFEVVTINPVLVMGPNICNGDFTSGVIVRKMLSGKYPGLPRIMMPLVDVREVAQAHLQAIKVPEARNQRFVLSSESLWFREMAVALKAEFGDWYKFKTCELSYCTAKMASLFMAEVRLILPLWAVELRLNNEKSRQVLGLEYRPAAESLKDMGYSLIESGLLRDKRKAKK